MSVANLIENLSGLSVLELVTLIKELEEKWGVKAAAPTVAVAGAASAGESTESVKKDYDVVLSVAPENKINAIKAVKESLNLSLTDAKGLVDKGVGSVLKAKVPKDEAEELKKKLEAGGMKIELK
jgi:large subunit ribosomal protein L7/L12